MGDILLKQRQTHQWQSMEMLARKPWPPIYPQRDPCETQSAYAYARYSNNNTRLSKNQQHFVAPYYRNAVPPLLHMDHHIKRRNVHNLSPCRCKSKSLEDVRDIAELRRECSDAFSRNRLLEREEFSERNHKWSWMDNRTNYHLLGRVGGHQVCATAFLKRKKSRL